MQPPAQPPRPQPQALPDVKHILAVSSCKGGVGKSTVAANLAVGLARQEWSVGLLDADIHGPSLHTMMGARQEPQTVDGRIQPVEAWGVKVMSLGMIAGEDTPVIWRGPIVGKMIQQFLIDVDWGALDVLVVDLPPGTGDAQLTLAQTIALTGVLIVTTPQEVALEDVTRGVEMFRTVDVPILGIVENMSYFECADCGDRVELFGSGGGGRVSEHFRVPLLGAIPIVPSIREGGDSGQPAAASDGDAAHAFTRIAEQLVDILDQAGNTGPEITIH